jgi:uncharacterized protein Yka (UPF0111/DUF47 family)
MEIIVRRIMTDENWDFGFTAVDESELEIVKKVQEEASLSTSTVEELQDKVDKLYNAILPLLANLKKDPEKDYILWKNRVEKVNEFEEYLNKIVGK